MEKEIDKLKKIINAQHEEINALKSKLKQLESKTHNERGAGRKSTLTKGQIEKITELQSQGLSYGAIAKEVGISKAYVYKLINKQINTGHEKQIMTEEAYNIYRKNINALRRELRALGHTHSGTKDLPTYEEYISNMECGRK